MRGSLAVKRMVDVVGSAVGLVVLSPVLLAVAAAVKTSSPGPIFFLQERIGRDGKTFKICKFRTMEVGAEGRGEGVCVSEREDPRITPVGRFLRATSLDELPQLANVLVGHMSLVGPRPPVTYHPYDGYESYPDWAKKRFSMRPGMTGLVQVEARAEASWDERIRIDNRYVDGFSLLLDTRILMATVRAVVRKEGM